MKKTKIYFLYRKTRRKGHANDSYTNKTMDYKIARMQFFP